MKRVWRGLSYKNIMTLISKSSKCGYFNINDLTESHGILYIEVPRKRTENVAIASISGDSLSLNQEVKVGKKYFSKITAIANSL